MDAIFLRGSCVWVAVLNRGMIKSRLAVLKRLTCMTILDCDMVTIGMSVLVWGRAPQWLTVMDWNKAAEVKLCGRPPAVSVTGRWIRGLTVFGDVKT